MKPLCILIPFLFSFFSCGSNQELESAQKEINRLKQEISDKKFEYININKLVQEADKELSYITTEKKEIDDLLKSADALSNKRVILDKISKIKDHISESQTKLAKLEAELAQSKFENAHLQALVRQLRTELANKDATITELRGKVEFLESNIAQLRQDINTKETVIRQNEDIINKTTNDLAKKKGEIEEKDKKARIYAQAHSTILELLQKGDEELKFVQKYSDRLDVLNEKGKKINQKSDFRGADFYENQRRQYITKLCAYYAKALEVSEDNEYVDKAEILNRTEAKRLIYNQLVEEAGKKAGDPSKFSSNLDLLKACRGGFYNSTPR